MKINATQKLIDSVGAGKTMSTGTAVNIGEQFEKDSRNSEISDPKGFSQMSKDVFIEKLEAKIENGIKEIGHSFFVECIFAKDKLLSKLGKDAFSLNMQIRKTCPIPYYNRDLYFYDHGSSSVHHIWSIPTKYICDNRLTINPKIEGAISLFEEAERFMSGSYTELYMDLIKKEEG